jgi:ribosomal protein S6--L-glutamate ligase
MNLLIITAEPKNFVPVELEKSAKDLGVETSIIDISKTVLVEEYCKEDGLKSAAYTVDDEGKMNAIKVDKETCIIPRLNEYHTEIKLGILKRFELCGATLLNTPESMELCNDKLKTQVLLNSNGIKTPFSVMIQGLDEIEKVVTTLEEQKKITYPFVIKTLRGTHGIGVMKVDGRSSLVSVAQTLSKEGIDFMIQEFCKHEQSARIIMIGDQVLAANLRGQPKEKDEFRTNSHLGSETEKYEPSEEEISVAKKIVELFGCRFCAIDYLITEDKEIIVLEVNGSPGLENIQKNWPDKDLPKTVVEYVKNLHGSSDDSSTETSIEVVTEPENKDSGEIKSDEPESKTMIDEIESATIHRITSNVTARVDTGAKYCSLHVDRIIEDGNYVKFTRGDVTYKVPVIKYVKIRNANTQESVSRPVVMLDISVKGYRANQVEFTLNDRSNMKYEVLIGRNALQIWGLPVLVSQDNIQKTGDESSIEQVEEE